MVSKSRFIRTAAERLKMTEYEKAIAEFTAKQSTTVCPPAASKADYKAARRDSWDSQKNRQQDEKRYEANERNAENKRYDNEGVYYIGGKL